MKINSLSPVNSFALQSRRNGAPTNVLNFPSKKLPQYNKLSFMASPLLYKYSNDFYGLTLLNQTNTMNRDSGKYEKAIKYIQNAAFEKLFEEPKTNVLEKPHPVIWSITSEFAPIKEGGLGSVPPEIRNNAEKLGVNVPTFIPMYLNEGSSTFIENNGKYIYKKGDDEFLLEKIVSYKMDTFKDGKIETIPVEIYLYTDEDENNKNNKRQLVFIKTDKYFDGTIYEESVKTEESEKFAVFTKAVYEFLKLKTDGARALKDVHMFSSESLEKIKEPDGIMLNDWQASPLASLLRYKAPMENAYKQLSDDAAEKLKNMTIATIGHNCTYQGSTLLNNNEAQKREATNNILNTLFDKYTNDIVTNAITHASEVNPKDKGLVNLDNVLVMNYKNSWENSVNFLNMGVVLSDYFLPVSKNYALELTDPKRNDLSGAVQWALTQKQKSNRLTGIINGNDYDNLNIENQINKIKKGTGIDFKTYSRKTATSAIIEARRENKFNLYNEYMRPASEAIGVDPNKVAGVKKLTAGIEFYKDKNNRNLPQIDKKTFDNTPVLSIAGRLVSQKGIDVAVDAIAKLFKNWNSEFPECEKPIIYFAGSDNEGGVQRKRIEDLINERLSKEDASRIVFAYGRVPMSAIMAGSDFFLMPSKFEPCGLTQGESLAVATPVIASAVGGIVDTVNRNGKHTGFLTDKNVKLDGDEFYSAIMNGLDTYFYEKDKYQNMITDCINEDFSWIQKGKQGPVYDYLELFGIKRETLPDVK